MRSSRPWPVRYGAALGATVLAVALALVLDPLLSVHPFPLFLAAVMFAAWYGGMAPGLMVTVLGVAALDFLFFAPTFTLTVHYASDAVNLAVYLLVALLISSLNARLLSARRRAEQLAAERAAILGQMADGVVITDPTGRVAFVNETARRMFGWGPAGDPDDYRGVGPFARPDGSPQLLDELPLTRAVERGEAVMAVELRLGGQGAPVAVEAYAGPVLSEDGTRVGAVLVLHDVTAQRVLERQKDEFLANVSHDLRTPLTAIKHSIDVVLANEPSGTSEDLHSLFVNVSTAADRMAVLVDDLLELTRLQAGKVHLRSDECDLRDVVRRAVGAVGPLVRAREQELRVDLPPEPVRVRADAARLERALLNLLGNAQKYGRRGGTIRVGLEQAAGEVTVAVSDDGPGIPEAEQGRIFERFYRSSGEAARRTPGSGLGLPIALALVELHGGRITIESRVGAGATFRVVLPSSDRAAA